MASDRGLPFLAQGDPTPSAREKSQEMTIRRPAAEAPFRIA